MFLDNDKIPYYTWEINSANLFDVIHRLNVFKTKIYII